MSTKYSAQAARLKEERHALGVTQIQLAQRVGMSLAGVKGYERGMRLPNADYRERLNAVGIDIQYVLSGKRSPRGKPCFKLHLDGRLTLLRRNRGYGV